MIKRADMGWTQARKRTVRSGVRLTFATAIAAIVAAAALFGAPLANAFSLAGTPTPLPSAEDRAAGDLSTMMAGQKVNVGPHLSEWIAGSEQVTWQMLDPNRAVIFRNGATTDADDPVPAMSSDAGKILFWGWQMGRRLVGRSQFRAEGCQRDFSFIVKGWISPQQDSVVLTGVRPRIKNCEVDPQAGKRPDTIVLRRAGE